MTAKNKFTVLRKIKGRFGNWEDIAVEGCGYAGDKYPNIHIAEKTHKTTF
jgi:hypothetical protein